MIHKRKLRRDLTGQVFNGIEAIKFSHRDKGNKAWWTFRCHCGREFVTNGYQITSGKYRSCGCQHNIGKHRLSSSRIYNIWVGMKQRCRNPKSASYYKYGGRGIDYCDSWDSFDNFYEDIKESYQSHVATNGEKNTTIERVDNSLGYYKENCRWATPKEQARNVRTNHLVTHQGLSLCVSEWSERTGINVGTLHARFRYGWSVEDALSKKVQHKSN